MEETGDTKSQGARAHTDLLVWQKGIELVTLVYRVTAAFPKSELYGLTMQLRRCAVSIPSNIAEGFGRRSDAEFARFLLIARGSLFEVDTQLLIARRLGFLKEEDYRHLSSVIDDEKRMIDPLLQHLRKSG